MENPFSETEKHNSCQIRGITGAISGIGTALKDAGMYIPSIYYKLQIYSIYIILFSITVRFAWASWRLKSPTTREIYRKFVQDNKLI